MKRKFENQLFHTRKQLVSQYIAKKRTEIN